MSTGKVTVVAKCIAKPGMEEQVKDTIMALVGPTRSEAGCINYDLHLSTENPSIFMLYENWRSKKDLDDHLNMPYLKDFVGKADSILAGPLEIALWEMISETS
jgi:quinol monooxygenase YgiN